MGVIALLLFGSCASHNFHTTRLQQTDFTQYKTYGWLPPIDSLSKDYYNNAIAKGNIINTTNEELQARGLTYSKEDPDVLFRYVALVNNKSRLIYGSPYYAGWGGPWGWYRPWYYGAYYHSYPVGKERVRYGHIILEAIDRRTDAVVWQARGTGRVDIPEDAINELPKVMKGIMKEYPVSAKKK
jgi:hypothetical protein